MNLVYINKNHITSDIWQIVFKKPKNFKFKPGQFIETYIDDPNPDERGNKRWFTISSSPTQSTISITTRLIAPKHSEFKNDLFNLEPNQTISIKNPEGSFILPSKNTKILWLAGGIGITPFMSQMQYMFDTKDFERDIILLHGLRTLEEDPCADLIQKCQKVMPKLKIIRVLSESSPTNWRGPTGYIDKNLLSKQVPDLTRRDIYISGPEPMVDSFTEMLLSVGVNKDQLHQDWFPGYTEKY